MNITLNTVEGRKDGGSTSMGSKYHEDKSVYHPHIPCKILRETYNVHPNNPSYEQVSKHATAIDIRTSLFGAVSYNPMP